jgi:phosphatidylserine decarboxylase
LFVALILYTVAFFRDPDRPDPAINALWSRRQTAQVADIREIDEEEFLKARSKRIGIFLSIFDVHTNRAPCRAAVLLFSNIARASFLTARRP